MKVVFIIISLVFLSPSGAHDGQRASITPLSDYSKSYDPARDPFKDGRDALAHAKATNRRVLIEVGGDWCSWCHIIERFLRENPDIYAALLENFVVLKINVSDKNGNHEFMSGLPGPLGYPHFYITENNGTIIQSQDTSELLEDGHYSRVQFLKFIEQWGVDG